MSPWCYFELGPGMECRSNFASFWQSFAHMCNSAQRPSTTIALYRVDTIQPFFHQLVRTTRHHDRPYENSVVAEGNLWAFSWSQTSRQLLAVRNILMNGDEVEKEVVFDIGEPIHVSLCATQNLLDWHLPKLMPRRHSQFYLNDRFW